jgi:DNA-directed RNA polymerase specialized sigma24 family protein
LRVYYNGQPIGRLIYIDEPRLRAIAPAMNPLGLPLATCAAVITSCLGMATRDEIVDAATIQSIDRYCEASWQRANIPRQEWDDCSQHAFVRILKRLSRDRLAEAIENRRSKHRRELNRCIWATTQWWRRSYHHRSLTGDDVPDSACTARVSDVTVPDVWEAIESGAAGLTAMQRRIIELWANGHSIADMATELGVPSRRVSDEKFKAIAKLRANFQTC